MSMEMYQNALPAPLHIPTWLIEANQVLALSSAELQSLVQKELEENPALELEEHPVCTTCGRTFQGSCCPHCCSPASSLPQIESAAVLDDAGSWFAEEEGSAGEGDEFDPTPLIPAKLSLAEQLRLALRAQLPEADTMVIDYLVGNLDDDGYLHCSAQEAAQICGVSLERAERVLAALQAQEPIGVGARSGRECLLIQLRYWEAQGVYQPYAAAIIDRYLPELAEHRYGQIARQLQTGVKQIREAHAFIKQQLHPFPASGYLGAGVSIANGLARPIQPDVVIGCRPDAAERCYEIEVVEAQRFGLQISQTYAEAARSLGIQRGGVNEEYQHIHEYLKRSKLFIANVKRRWQTLYHITAYLVKAQPAFLEQGVRALRPLTREQVAEALGLHPSTVSRATAAKYVMLPNKQVIPFSTFFQPNLSLKETLKDLIRREPKPLSDQKLVDLLNARGWKIARRTIAKYRAELKILPSSAR